MSVTNAFCRSLAVSKQLYGVGGINALGLYSRRRVGCQKISAGSTL